MKNLKTRFVHGLLLIWGRLLSAQADAGKEGIGTELTVKHIK